MFGEQGNPLGVGIVQKGDPNIHVSLTDFFSKLNKLKICVASSGHTNEVNQVKFNKQKTILASCSDDYTARIWLSETWTNSDGSIALADQELTEAESAKKYPAKFILNGHTNPVGAIRWCPAENGNTETLMATYALFIRYVSLNVVIN